MLDVGLVKEAHAAVAIVLRFELSMAMGLGDACRVLCRKDLGVFLKTHWWDRMPEACHKAQVWHTCYFERKMVRRQARREQTESYDLPACCAALHVNVNGCSPFLEPFERQGSSWGHWGSRDLHEVVRDWRYCGHVKVVLLSNDQSLPVKTNQDLSIDQCWTGKDRSFGVWSGLWPFGHWSRPVSVPVNPKLGPKTGPDRTLKHY